MIDPIARRTHDVFEQSTEGADERLGAWLRERDRLGALSETHAALDTAFSRGYAQGHEEALAERLDAARTVSRRNSVKCVKLLSTESKQPPCLLWSGGW